MIKKYILPAALLLCLGLLLAGCAIGDRPGSTGKAVEFADPNLEEALRAALEKPAGELTVEDLSGLEELNAPVRDIADLGGLEHAVNLRYLNLYRNRITDLSPLSGLAGLEVLILSDNDITDISPLGELAKLRELNLAENRIRDLAMVQWEKLASLEKLDLRYNYLRLSDPDTAGILKALRQAGVDLQVEPTYYD
jgi:Leucine-rich repeat (LRR) protein